MRDFICIFMLCLSVPVFVFLKVTTVYPVCSTLVFLTPTSPPSSLSRLALISLLPCVDYLWRLPSSPLSIPAHIQKKMLVFSAPSCSTFPSLFSRVVPYHWLLCIPCAHSPLSRHPFAQLPVDRAPMAPRLPFTHWRNRGSIITFNRQSSLCSQCFIMALALLLRRF